MIKLYQQILSSFFRNKPTFSYYSFTLQKTHNVMKHERKIFLFEVDLKVNVEKRER